MPFALPPLYPILDEAYLPPGPEARTRFLDTTVRELADAGVSLLQLRCKSAPRDQLVRDATVVRAAGPGLVLILNDHAELVRECGFDGVHLGQTDLGIEAARQLLGANSCIGLSTHTPLQVAAGDATSANYLAAGPVFTTGSKSDAEPAIGIDGVQAARLHSSKPLVAIGGITAEFAPAVWAAGAQSIALISALFPRGAGTAQSPGQIARDFLRLFR